jgi:hypothetical protein
MLTPQALHADDCDVMVVTPVYDLDRRGHVDQREPTSTHDALVEGGEDSLFSRRAR